MVAALANLLLTSIGAVEIVFLVRVAGVTARTVGVMFAAGGAGGLAGALSASRIDRRVGTHRVARCAIASTAPFALLLPWAHRGPTLALFGLGAFAAIFGIVLATVTFATIRQTCCPPELLGRVLAGSRLLIAITIPLGALAGDTVGQYLGPRTAILGSVIGYALSRRHHGDRPAAQARGGTQRACARSGSRSPGNWNCGGAR